MKKLWFISLIFPALIFAGCKSEGTTPVGSKPSGGESGETANKLSGGGSSFVNPIMSKWTSEYHKKTEAKINYQSMGSSGGVKQFSVKTLDFGATDAPMKDEQITEAGGSVLHIPVVMGAVALCYNIDGKDIGLNLDGDTIGKIYQGTILKWNDPALVALNPGVALPDADIKTVRRSDGSGTTFIFSDFLAKTNGDWKEKVGVGNSLEWPGESIGGKGNEGVSASVQRTPNSIGYVELIYALEAKMPVAKVKSADGESVLPSPESVTAAAAALTEIPEDLRVSITNSPGSNSYPLSGIVWVVARPVMDAKDKAKLLKEFMTYVLSDEGQAVADDLQYSKLPAAILEKARAQVAKIEE